MLPQLPVWRAAQVARSLQDPVDRKVANGLVALRTGKRVAAREKLTEALRMAPRHPAARAGRLRLEELRIAEGLDPEALVSSPLDAAERAVVEGWRAASPEAHGQEQGTSLRSLEASLATVPTEHPLARDAARLRAEWRIASGDPALAREAIEIAELGVAGRGNAREMLLRARACAAAGEQAATLDTLMLLSASIRQQGPYEKAHAQQGLRVLRSLPPDPALQDLRAIAQRSLTRRSQ